MKSWIKTSLTVCGIVCLCGCSSGDATMSQSDAASEEAILHTATTTPPNDQNAIAPATRELGEQTKDKIEVVTLRACLNAIEMRTTDRPLRVLSREFSHANSLYLVSTNSNSVHWRCFVSNTGVLLELIASGTEPTAQTGDQGAQLVSPDIYRIAVNACMQKARLTTGEADVRIVDAEFDTSSSLVRVGVGDDERPLQCKVSNDGAVIELIADGWQASF